MTSNFVRGDGYGATRNERERAANVARYTPHAAKGIDEARRAASISMNWGAIARGLPCARQLASNFLKYAIVSLRPSSSPTVGAQPSRARAMAMSGIR